MSGQEFLTLWRDKALYDESFIKKFGMQSPHWTFENNQKRELSLRHDYICALLCNMEKKPLKRSIDEVDKSFVSAQGTSLDEPISKKRREDENIQEDDSGNLVISDSELDHEYETMSEAEDPEYDWIPPQEEKEGEADESYRYWLLEGNLHSAAIQNWYCKKFGIEKFRKIYDIVDTQHEKFIEVKVSLNPEARLKDYLNDPESDNPHTSLIVIHPETFEFHYSHMDYELPGKEKAIVFLTKRQTVMKQLGISDNTITENVSMESIVLDAEYLEDEIKNFTSLCMEGTSLFEDDDFNLTEEPTLGKISPTELFNLLEDPSENEGEIVKWKGVMLPPKEVLMQSTDSRDLESVKSFMNEISMGDPELISGDVKDFNTLVEMKNHNLFNHAQVNNFRYHIPSVKNSTEMICLKERLGIGKKGLIHNDTAENVVQEEPKIIKKMKYHPWFERTIQTLLEPHRFEKYTANQLEIEKLCYLDLGKELQTIAFDIFEEIGSTNLGVIMSQYTNLGARISGTYLVGSSKKSSHSAISCIPLVATLYDKEDKTPFRVSSGICFRAPHHARNANDSINLFLVERLSKEGLTNDIGRGNRTIVKIGIMYYSLRQTAIRKNTAVHITFLYNSIFNAMNLLGELVLNNRNIRNMDQLVIFARSMSTTKESLNYIKARVVESFLMAVIGNSRDEGYLAMARKVYMIILAWRRGQFSFTWDVKEFSEKINECLIDNPLSMHLHMNFLYIIAQYAMVMDDH